MIARLWSARATPENARRYAQHLRETVLPAVKKLPGYLGAMLLERVDGADIEITVMTRWTSLDHIRAFAGAEIERAVVADRARALLKSYDERVRHATVAHEE